MTRLQKTLSVVLALCLALLPMTAQSSVAQAAPPEPTAPFLSPTGSDPVREFDGPEHRWDPGHRGVDLVATAGDPIRAPADGVVSFSGSVAGRQVLTITHAGGVKSSFEVVDRALAKNTRLQAGDIIGYVGKPPAQYVHCPGNTCVHWGVRINGEYVDPMSLLRSAPRIVLLPVHS